MRFTIFVLLVILSLFGFSTAGKSAVCSLPPADGEEGQNCMAYRKMYYFDTKTNQCKTFEYSGCGGNGNKFDTIALCERACKHHA